MFFIVGGGVYVYPCVPLQGQDECRARQIYHVRDHVKKKDFKKIKNLANKLKVVGERAYMGELGAKGDVIYMKKYH